MSKADENVRDILKRCVQALLNRNWITKQEDPELFNHIRVHYEELRDWFREYCGFALLLNRQFAKLEKAPGKARAWMGFDNFAEPRDYALFCYCLWYLEGKNEMDQFLLTDMVEEIREYLAGQDVFLDWTIYTHRLSMARALKQLKALGVLVAVDGDESEWARSGHEHNVLYESSNLGRYVLRRFPRDLTTYDSIASFEDGTYSDTSEGQLKKRRHRVYRRLLQEPVVYDWQWSEDERYYVRTQRHTILENLSGFAGLEGQRYREGLLFFYPEPSGEMYLFPTGRGVSDICLLLAGELRRRLARGAGDMYIEEGGRIGLAMAELEGILLQLKEKHKSLWSRQHRQARSSELAEEVLAHLEEWGLAGREGDGRVWIYAALGRWNGDYDVFGGDE
ncbi:TIGR02678 family protein [Desulfoscipio geothermicus]|uniref:TIGR02678 family protein n=1 Tax=Desulfoscipio geothermicus DSM 3669 TaxID=1121426 RepID=A0A1I6DWC3_9FIRM|nr:TIGR02678 family protein [Desulfoscipio geothermicus]SFR09667.1 TIGR02678 family protein [Desulfoscipio geothermicus DSM 3669]